MVSLVFCCPCDDLVDSLKHGPTGGLVEGSLGVPGGHVCKISRLVRGEHFAAQRDTQANRAPAPCLKVLIRLARVRRRVSYGCLYLYTHAHTHMYLKHFVNKSLSCKCDRSLYYSVYKQRYRKGLCMYIYVCLYIYMYIHTAYVVNVRVCVCACGLFYFWGIQMKASQRQRWLWSLGL